MKINGKELKGPQEEVVVIPRGNEEIIIKARAVLDFTAFEQINPQPEPPEIMRPGGEKSVNPEDPRYLKAIATWAESKSNWMIIKSLEATPGISWDTIDMAVPSTWVNFRKELADTFTPGELGKIMDAVMTACGLNQAKIEEATKRFLATMAEMQ